MGASAWTRAPSPGWPNGSTQGCRSRSTDGERILQPITGDATYEAGIYQSLSHRFLLRSNDRELAGRAATLIDQFARPVHADRSGAGRGAPPVTYSLRITAGPGGQPLYALDRGDQRVSESHDSELVMRQLIWQISGDTVELADGYLLVHAGAVVTARGEGVVILGEPGSGKSTVVAALVQEGFGYLSDEAAAIELDTGLLHPWPRPLGFKHGSRSIARFAGLFEDERQDPTIETHVPVERIRSGAIARPSPVGYVIDHRYEPGVRLKIEPLSRATAVVRMGSAAPRLRREGDRGLAVLARLMESATAYSLVSGELGDSVRAIREHVTS